MLVVVDKHKDAGDRVVVEGEQRQNLGKVRCESAYERQN